MNSDTLEGVLASIYEAALHPGQWQSAVEAIRTHLGVDALTLLAADADTALPVLLLLTGSPSGRAATPGEGHGRVAQELLGWSLSRLGGARSGELVLARIDESWPDALRQREGGALRLDRAAGSLLFGDASGQAVVWLLRCGSAPAFDEDDRGRFNRLGPHLARALTIRHRVGAAENQASALLASFDRVAIGAVLVDSGGRPLAANRAATRIAQERDGISFETGGLRASTATLSRELRALARAPSGLTTPCIHEQSAGLRLPRPSGKRDLEVIAVPLARARASKSAAAVLFIVDPERARQTPLTLLEDLYGLTPAEGRLAWLLLQGHSLTKAAASLSISRNTAHSQLASIFRKTGASRQAELVRMLLAGPAAVRTYDTSSSSHPAVKL